MYCSLTSTYIIYLGTTQCLSPRPNWDPPNPSPATPQETPGTKEGGGGGGVPTPTTGEKASHSVYSVCSPVLCVLHEANNGEHEEAGEEGVA